MKTVVEQNKIENPEKGNPEKKGLKLKKAGKGWVAFLIFGIVFILGGVGCLLFALLKPEEELEALSFPKLPSSSPLEATYSALTGEVLSDPNLKNAPVYCVQIPNGLDGARPQVGLTEAGVIFEAIAEAGITRFASIFQNPTTAVIGPIRSLRIYYLEWDTPFDCAIVHAGGAADAIAAVRAGGYKDLTENYAYMYRGTVGRRLWNNLFTTSSNLRQFAADTGFSSSDLKGFSRMTPEDSRKARVDGLVSEKLNIITAASGNTSELVAKTSGINLTFGWSSGFNVRYDYDLASNTYRRSYGSGEAHEVYRCPDENLGEVNPEGNCDLVQLAPSVVIAMIVNESKAPGGYYESIPTIGTGEVYIFQNGMVLHGTWNKASKEEQIRFYDEGGSEISLAPGQTIISAVPGYGGVEY